MSLADASDDLFATEPIRDRFEIFGPPQKGRRRIQRMVDHKTERYVAIRRIGGKIDETRVRALLGLRSDDLFPLTEALSDEDGPYLVGDFGDVSLADRLGKGPFAEGDLLGIAVTVGRAMKFLHDRGFYPLDPTPENLREAANGAVRIAAITLPISDAEAELPGAKNPIVHDLKTLGQTMVCLATGRANADPSDTSAVPSSIVEIVNGCLKGSFGDANALLVALGVSRPNAAVRPAPAAVEATFMDDGHTQVDPSVVASEVTETEDPEANDGSPRRSSGQESQTDPFGERPAASSSGGNAFPWRPAGELYRIAGNALEGGMGSVCMAIEIATNRKVAIKRILMHSGMRQSSLDRFYREAQSIANLNHPHVLQLLQPGRDDEGDYLVLEWAAGGSLKDQIVKHGTLPPDQVKAIARKIGSALAYAHKKGIVHRDIKPHNILLTETGEPKLADFGLARSMVDLTLSSSRGGAGSPLYMAPEQHESTREATAQSDLYSFGKTLYQLLTGKAPTNPDPKLLPADMRRAIMRCMEEEPELRPANAEEFLKDLELGEKPTKPVLAYALVALVLIAAVVAFQAGWIPFGGNGGKGDPDPKTGAPKVAGGHDATDPSRGTGSPGSTLARASIAGILALVAGGQDGAEGEEVEVQEGGSTISEKVQIEVQFDRPIEQIDKDQIRVRRNGTEIARKLLSITEADGKILVTVPLDKDVNRFSIDLGDQADIAPKVIETTVSREYPSVAFAFDSGVKAAGSTVVSSEDRVHLSGEVTGGPISQVFLRPLNGDIAQAVRVAVSTEKSTENTFSFDLELPDTDGVIEYEWYWPKAEAGYRLVDAKPLKISVDRTNPVVEISPPQLNENTFTISGRVDEAHRTSENVDLVLALDGSPWNTVRIELNGRTTFQQDIPLPPATFNGKDSELTMTASYQDAVGLTGTSLPASLRIDRLAPAVVVGSSKFQKAGDLVTVTGTANEPLGAVRVNDRTAKIIGDSQFEAKIPLDAYGVYKVALEDRHFNTSTTALDGPKPVAATSTVNPGVVVIATPPKLEVAFESGPSGIAIAVVTADKPLTSVVIGGAAASNAGGAWRGSVGQKLSDLRDPLWTPTQHPVVIQATAADGSTHSGKFVSLPAQWFTRSYPPIGYELGGTSGDGVYCTQIMTRPDHTSDPGRNGAPADCFVPSGSRCTACGWQKG